MKTHNTHCGLRLGDNLAHLQFLRKLALTYPDHQFVHAAHVQYLHQLLEMSFDVPNIKLIPFEYRAKDSLDVWKNAGGFWERHPLRFQYASFMLAFFDMTAQEMGLKSPLEWPADLLFDSPQIQKAEPRVEPFDVLIVNSAPLSNQAPYYEIGAMDYLISELAKKYKILTTAPSRIEGVPCTAKNGYTVTDIGNCSIHCKHIVMVSTGASWLTFNKWNLETVETRVVILQQEKLGLGPNEIHVQDVTGARQALLEKGLL